MGWFSSILIGLMTAALGCVGAGYVANKFVRWYRISGFEGGAGYYVILIALLGLGAGLVIGIVCARIVSGWDAPGFPKGLGLALGSMSGLVLVSGLLAWLGADLSPEIDGRELEVMIEVRAPDDFVLPVLENSQRAFASVYLPHGRRQPTGELKLDEARQVEGRWILSSVVPLDTSVATKYLRVYMNAENDLMFALPLRRRPTPKDFEWSNWIEAGWTVGTPEPPAAKKFHMRFRVQQEPLPPPRRTQADEDAEKAEAEQAAFDAIPSDSPVATWLPHTRYGANEDRLGVAMANISARETLVEELAVLTVSPDTKVATDALAMIQHLEEPPKELNGVVAAAGRSIAASIRKVNATTVEEDPGYQAAADVSLRFSSWMVAVRALRKNAGGDFTPELREILELARQRPDSQEMRGTVVRIASYYLKEWAGLEPLPTDPKPR